MSRLHNPWPEHEGELFKLSDILLIKRLLIDGLSLQGIALLFERSVQDIDMMLWRTICLGK